MRPIRAVLLLFAAGFGLLLFLPSAASAAWPDTPGVGVPLCTASGNQWNSAVVSDGAGGAIVTWQDYRAGDHSTADIYAQRILADGSVAWTDGGVPLCTATGNQLGPAITSDSAGGAIVTWQDHRAGNGDIYAQAILADGSVRWAADGVALRADTLDMRRPAIASDGAGGAYVTWELHVTSLYSTGGIYAQRISGDGTVLWAAGGIGICTLYYERDLIDIISDGEGGAIVAWWDYRFGGRLGCNLLVQRLYAVGTNQWTANGVDVGPWWGTASMVSDGAGGVIFAWEMGQDIYAQRISAAGVKGWNWSPVTVCGGTGAHLLPTIASDDAGGAIIAWEDGRGTDYDIYAQRVSAAGVPLWTADGVALTTASFDQLRPRITPDGSGGAIAAWGDSDIYAQRISADGVPQWSAAGQPICTANGGQYAPAITSDGAGGAIIAWHDYRDDGGDDKNADIYAQRVWADGTTPALLSLISADVTADGVRLVWYMGGGGGGAAVVHRCLGGDAWAPIGEVVADGTGYLRYTDPVDHAAARVGYRLGIVEAGVESFYGETWVDLPAREAALALDPVRPNPASGRALTVRFTLPSAAPALLELLDVAGRRVASREVGSLGVGSHTTDLNEGGRLAPGIYLVRLTQGTNQQARRVAVVD
jgi:hypothetical protein